MVGGQSQSTAANAPPGRSTRATSAKVAAGSIQCGACTAMTTSALADTSPVSCP